VTGTFLRGAFVSFTEGFIASVPNVIPFQFNPEQMTHALERAKPIGSVDTNPLSVTGEPAETFSFELHMSAREMIADGRPATAKLATTVGLASRMAALEMLQFPTVTKEGATSVTTARTPAVLFVWGAGRIVPVALTSLRFTETLFDELLNPIQVQADVQLQVLTRDQTAGIAEPLLKIVKTALSYHSKKRETLAIANLATVAEAPIGVLPFQEG
jgi:hypothetical protein